MVSMLKIERVMMFYLDKWTKKINSNNKLNTRVYNRYRIKLMKTLGHENGNKISWMENIIYFKTNRDLKFYCRMMKKFFL